MEYSFEKAKIVGGISGDDEYWKGLEEGEFRMQRCSDCKQWMWPAQFRCGQCGSWEMEWVAMPPVGTVYSWTRSWMAFERIAERAEDVPYVTILAEIPAAGNARVMGIMKGSEDNLRIGAKLRGEIDPPSPKTKGYASIRWIVED